MVSFDMTSLSKELNKVCKKLMMIIRTPRISYMPCIVLYLVYNAFTMAKIIVPVNHFVFFLWESKARSIPSYKYSTCHKDAEFAIRNGFSIIHTPWSYVHACVHDHHANTIIVSYRILLFSNRTVSTVTVIFIFIANLYV